MPRLLRLQDVRLTARPAAPPGYAFSSLVRLRLDWRLATLQIVIVPVAWLGFALMTASRGGPADPRLGLSLPRPTPLDLVVVLLTVAVALPVAHELAHGLVAASLGGRPVYGIGPGLAFCHVREFTGRNAYLAILGAPLVLLTVLGVAIVPVVPPVWRGPLLALLVANAAGAVGDLALLGRAVRLTGAALIADTREGFEVYLPIEAERPT